jgi:hypothetical protein
MRINAGGNMKGLIFLVVALATAAHAQQATTCLKLSQVKVDHRVVHQYGTTEVKLKFEAKDCYVLTESPNLGRQMPILEIQNETGLTAQIGAVGALRFDQSMVSASTLKAQEISATINLAASYAATLGQHKLAGTIRYKAVDSQGSVTDEMLSFNVPIKVEPTVPNSPGFTDRHPVWTAMLVPVGVVVLVALLPLVLLAELMGWDGC